jgi:hypothetical protein
MLKPMFHPQNFVNIWSTSFDPRSPDDPPRLIRLAIYQLVHTPVSSAIELYLARSLSLLQFLTCVSSLNSILRILTQPDLTAATFPDIHRLRIVQVIHKRSSVNKLDLHLHEGIFENFHNLSE